MSKRANWDFGDLEGYIREGEPGQSTRAENWQVAIGLQAVDGLTTSAYLLETAREHIEGRIDIGEAQRRIRSYYDEREGREDTEGEQEADVVSSRIAELLGERAFTLSPLEMCDIHRRLFDQVLPRAGKYRNYNITKKEWVLKGETVYWSTWIDSSRTFYAVRITNSGIAICIWIGTNGEPLPKKLPKKRMALPKKLPKKRLAAHVARFSRC